RLFALNDLGHHPATHRALDDVLHIRDAHVPVSALIPVDREFEVRLALDAEYPRVLDAGDSRQDVLDLFRDALQLIEVGADDLDGVLTFHTGEDFHHVVPDVLGEAPVHAHQVVGHLRVNLLDQLVFGPRAFVAEPAPPALLGLDGRPLIEWLDGDQEL